MKKWLDSLTEGLTDRLTECRRILFDSLSWTVWVYMYLYTRTHKGWLMDTP